MFFRKPRNKTADMESVSTEVDTLFNVSSSCQPDKPKILKVDAIDNHNFPEKDVRLLDISSNKEWVAYLSYDRYKTYGRSSDAEKVYKTFLTRRRFTAVDIDSHKKVILERGSQKIVAEDEHFSVEISDYIGTTGSNYCTFLSISDDGLYIALSFYEKNYEKDQINDNCLIFQVRENGIELHSSPKCSGRAVFLNEEKTSLAFIDVKTLRYANFISGTSDKTTLDLNIFDSGTTPELSLFHNSYIKNSPWLDFEGDNGEIKKLITITRHIKHNLITTPFNGGIARTWSIKENGVRLTSFEAKGQHIMAFSKDYKFTAAYVEGTRSVNVYNVKSSLLVYRLKSQEDGLATNFEVSHIRFCYGGQYVAMSGWEDDKVVFEIWYLEAEKSIYRKSQKVGKRSYKSKQLKVFEPFVKRVYNIGEEKCLMGFYMFNEGKQLETKCMELRIDEEKNPAAIEWIQKGVPSDNAEYEISNNLLEFKHLKCGYINVRETKYLIRFGKHTIQLWNLKGSKTEEDSISEEDELLYIRAYKAPDYGRAYSFRDNWKICSFNSIKFLGNISLGRLIVNIRDTSDDNSSEENSSGIYHTEEIFLPLDEVNGERKFDYHQLESACQALYYFFYESENKYEYNVNKNLAKLRSKTLKLVKSAIDNIYNNFNYFSTLSGSKTLVMLASFKEGREIIKLLLPKKVPISIFSFHIPLAKINNERPEEVNKAIEYWKGYYSKMKDKLGCNTETGTASLKVTKNKNESNDVFKDKIIYRSSEEGCVSSEKCEMMATNENVLTVLIEESSYDLFKLLFNRILFDSKKLGPGCLSALTDALVFLQEEGNSDLLLSSSQKLSYLKIEVEKLGILGSELNNNVKIESPQKEYVANLRNLESHAIKEQLTKYGGFESSLRKYQDRFYSKYKNIFYVKRIYTFLFNVVVIIKYLVWEYITKDSEEKKKELSNLCVIPLPHFNSYNDFPEDRLKNSETGDDIIPYKKESAFTRIASSQNDNNIFRQGDTILEVLLEYKWKMFARKKFALICFIHALYYVSYSTGVLFSRTLYVKGENNEFDMEHSGHIVSLAVMGLSLAVLIYKEMQQFFSGRSKMAYIKSGYNWVDMAAFGFPALTVLQSLLGWDYFNEVCSVTTLILWLHGILRLRVISYFGVTLEIIIELFKNVFSVLFIMLLVVIAFTQAFVVLLRMEEDDYFRDNFSGNFTSNTTLSTGIVSTEGLTDSANISADNGFVNWFKAFSQVWFFIYGVWDPVMEGKAGDSKMLMAMCILFSFITVLIFFNMVIALMSSTVEDVKKRGKKVWVSHFAAVVSEIELLWCSDKEKRSRINNPTYIYYIANSETISTQEKELKKETRQLSQELGISLNESD